MSIYTHRHNGYAVAKIDRTFPPYPALHGRSQVAFCRIGLDEQYDDHDI